MSLLLHEASSTRGGKRSVTDLAKLPGATCISPMRPLVVVVFKMRRIGLHLSFGENLPNELLPLAHKAYPFVSLTVLLPQPDTHLFIRNKKQNNTNFIYFIKKINLGNIKDHYNLNKELTKMCKLHGL